MDISNDILFFLVVLVLLFLIDYFFFLRVKLKRINNKKEEKSKKKKSNILEIDYVSAKFKIKKEKLYKTSVLLWIALINSFIISLVSTIITIIPGMFIIRILIGVLLLFLLIYSIYEIFGRRLEKKYNSKKN